MEGGCRCEAIRIRATQPPVMTMACHCRGCQRMSSSAYSLSALFLSVGFEVTKGEPVLGGLRGSDAQHFFCLSCMTWMFTRPVPMPELVNVRPTMFDDPTWFAPYIETYAKNRLPWAKTSAVHAFEEFAPPESYGRLMQEFAATLG
jgi:hypothetical protein